FALEGVDHQIIERAVLHFCLNLPIQFQMAPSQRRDVAFSRHKQLLSAWWTWAASQIIHALSTTNRSTLKFGCKTSRDQLTKGNRRALTDWVFHAAADQGTGGPTGP